MMRAAFIASVFDQSDPLAGVIYEADGIQTLINSKSGWKSFPMFKVNLETIGESFSKTEYQYQIFHFTGHAVSEGLQFNDTIGTMAALEAQATTINYLVNPAGLAKMITAAHQLQLVFLNGCSTKDQIDQFYDAGVAAVIYTNYAVKDKIAVHFAKQFYSSFFKGDLSLKEAFEVANGYIIGLQKQGDTWIDEDLHNAFNTRGLNLQKPIADQPLYALKATDAVLKQKLSDWPEAKTTPQKDKAKALLIPDNSILLCNRGKEADTFKTQLTNTLAEGQLVSPVFLMVHDLYKACPLDLPTRFQRFDLPEFVNIEQLDSSSIEWHEFELPERRHRKEKGVCLERLNEIYSKTISPEEAAPNKIQQQNLIIYHNLNFLQVEWDDDLKNMFKYYIEDFSSMIKREFNLVKLVLFSIQYYAPGDPFQTYFSELENTYPNQVFNITGLSEIDMAHVGNWHSRVFRGQLDAMPLLEELIPTFMNPAPMLQAKTQLLNTIRKFNQR